MSALSESLVASIAVSREFVTGLDREPLGRFAVPLDALLAVDTLNRISSIFDTSGVMDDADANAVFDAAYDENNLIGSDADALWETALIEMLFWWDVWDVSDGDDYLGNMASTASHYRKQLDRLAVVHAHPSMNAYFFAGLWDIDFIEQCLADGVDAELAVSIRKS